MRRFLTIALPIAALILVAGVAFAQMGGGMAGGMGGMMGAGGMMMGGTGGMMGSDAQNTTPAQTDCHGGAGASAQQITSDKARELAEQYATANLPGFTVTKVEPLSGMHMTMYSVELTGPNNEVRVLHVNPWGQIMAHGSPTPRS